MSGGVVAEMAGSRAAGTPTDRRTAARRQDAHRAVLACQRLESTLVPATEPTCGDVHRLAQKDMHQQ
jgi:hypothetical protein